jgi:hypothetical protein
MKGIANKGLINLRIHQETYFGTICIKLIMYKLKGVKSHKEK